MSRTTKTIFAASLCVLVIFARAAAEVQTTPRRAQIVERMRKAREARAKRIAEMPEAERKEYFRQRMDRREIANMEKFAREMARGANPIRSIVLSEDMSTVTFTYTNGTVKAVSVK